MSCQLTKRPNSCCQAHKQSYKTLSHSIEGIVGSCLHPLAGGQCGVGVAEASRRRRCRIMESGRQWNNSFVPPMNYSRGSTFSRTDDCPTFCHLGGATSSIQSVLRTTSFLFHEPKLEQRTEAFHSIRRKFASVVPFGLTFGASSKIQKSML